MIDEYFEIFKENMGQPDLTTQVSKELIDKYSSLLPSNLIELWKEEGFSSYQKGLLWFTNPDEFNELIDMWLEGTRYGENGRYYVIARTAFGGLIAWSEMDSRVITVSCFGSYITGGIGKDIASSEAERSKNLGRFFAVRDIDSFDLQDELSESVFEKLIQQYGSLNRDNVFGFQPPLFVGGSISAKNAKPMDMQVHLTILREFGEPVVNE
ncbi:GAD-like domain-containing protein [Pleionea sediminis]|uniref:GAD-like domain-containing protein n=1 Tax=Pleionea sediminis TaxID=2569479 RepID=UPI001186301C|nr:GAD-like domain-containing protein [Pleionea sediminis]